MQKNCGSSELHQGGRLPIRGQDRTHILRGELMHFYIFYHKGRNKLMKLYTFNLCLMSHLSFSLTHRESVAASLCILWTSTRLRASVYVAQLQAPFPWMFPYAVLTARKHTTKSSPSLAATACRTPVRLTENRHTNLIKWHKSKKNATIHFHICIYNRYVAQWSCNIWFPDNWALHHKCLF